LLARAKAEGKQLGRPKVDEKTENAIRKARARKDRPGILKIAKELGGWNVNRSKDRGDSPSA
jgi:hypothetical protein